MKKTIQLSIYTALAFTMIACSMGPSPKSAADKFLTSFNERDFEEARKYATPETIKLLDVMESLTKMAQATDSLPLRNTVVLDEKIDGEIAIVTFKDEGSEKIQELKLKKIDGKWLVHINKEDLAAKNITDGNTDEEEGLWSDDDTLDIDSVQAE